MGIGRVLPGSIQAEVIAYVIIVINGWSHRTILQKPVCIINLVLGSLKFYNFSMVLLDQTRSGPNRPAAAIGGAVSLGYLAFKLDDRRLRYPPETW